MLVNYLAAQGGVMLLYQDSHKRVVGAILETCTSEDWTTQIIHVIAHKAGGSGNGGAIAHGVFPLEIGYQGNQTSSEFAAPSSRLA